ncbi:MAG: SDR family oxidoreductase [Microbacteriaceae bacterium]
MTESRRVLVTGASSGIGAATARLLAARGYRVVGIARRSEQLAALALETGIEVHTIDVTQEDDTDWIAEHLRATGGVDAVLNIAGGATDAASVLDADPDSWRAMFELNVMGVQRILAKTIGLLRESAAAHGYADILTVTSTAGFVPYETGGGYNVAKYGVRALMGVLRLELAGEPIRVIDVAPGQVKTEEFAMRRFDGDRTKYDALYEGVEQPLTAEDVAEVIVGALELPGHVNLDQVVVRPVAQAAQHKLHRGPLVPKL